MKITINKYNEKPEENHFFTIKPKLHLRLPYSVPLHEIQYKCAIFEILTNCVVKKYRKIQVASSMFLFKTWYSQRDKLK